ncbi:LysR family transcriptional regulator [Massilia sp. Root351]|jgi:DNA-binding transcriptional LysR family regulator|uniref:LysR family transcriptional regulator n=1 Tax=Massilia sp. Root351 TaxID=1736522 RepID=UPI00070F5A9B|nr:LysR family transcriptional regulator [Massilia sp. Root351]KQV90362.1 LysR family transcriptional regulator [Massilia sp. Root351]
MNSFSAAESDALASSFATTYAGVVAFIAVATEGSFARAADRLGIGRSAVSRSILKLETQLDTRLFLRTTRSTTLTSEGQLFYEYCSPGVERIVQAVEEMRDLRSGAPRGQLRLCATAGFGRKVVAPLLSGFRALYPDITVDLVLDSNPTDFIAKRVDVAFRNGRMDDSQVVAKQLIPMQLLVCASPAYARAHGLPDSVDDIARHRCITYRESSGRVEEWEFRVGGVTRSLQPKASCTFNDADLVLQAVLNGEGLAQLAGYQVCELLRSGELVAVLPQYAPDDRGHYLCYLNRRHLPTRSRVFIDYITLQIRSLDLYCIGNFSPP